MKLAMTLLVRDEIDIIKTHIEYHRPKVDLMIVTDNGSVDGTLKYLQSLQSDNFILIREPKHTYEQYKWVARMIINAVSHGADWVINSDADEFWTGDFRQEIAAAEAENCNVIRTYCSFFYPTFLDDLTEFNPVKRLLWRQEPNHNYPKVLHKTTGFLSIAQGNHDVQFGLGIQKKIRGTVNLPVNHYYIRGWEHYKRKFIHGGQAYLAFPMRQHKSMGVHWKEKYAVYEKLGEEGLIREYITKEYMYNQQRIEDKCLIRDTNLADIII